MSRHPPDYYAIQRSLAILRRLQIAPATRDELIDHVTVEVDLGDHPDDGRPTVKQFERDIARLRDLGVEIVVDEGHVYRLASYGAFSPVALAPNEIAALAFLGEAFAAGAPQAEAVQQLLRRMQDWLTVNQRTAVSVQRRHLRVDLQRRDDDVIEPGIMAAVERALDERRYLRFRYLSPGNADGLPREHTVAVNRIEFDTTRRHYYVDAYRTRVVGPEGVLTTGRYQRYRLGRILLEGISVLPEKVPPTLPKRRLYDLEYRLAPEIARFGQVTRHFDDMVVYPAAADGWVRVTAKTHDLFFAIQLLLGYGPRCEVIGGPEARERMAGEAQALAALYAAEPTLTATENSPISRGDDVRE